MNRNVIIVSPYFPPSSLAGVHRARHLAKHLPAAGWTPIVLCVDESRHEERLDQELAFLVPSSVEVVKVGALPVRLCRPLGFGDISLRAWFTLRRALFNLLAERPIDAVLITGSPYYPMLLAKNVRKHFGVPVILDFQDPWITSLGPTCPRWSKAGIEHRLAVALEPRALRAASYVTSVSQTQNEQMAARYPWLDKERMAAVPIGIDRDDFLVLENMLSHVRGTTLDNSFINLSYVGTFLPTAKPVMLALIRALAQIADTHPLIKRRVRLNFVGTSNQPNGTSRQFVTPIAKSFGVEDLIKEIPQRVPYLDALAILRQSDGLFLLGSTEPHYTASKIFPALLSGRPYLSIFHGVSSAHAILSEAGGGMALAFSDSEQLDLIQGQIRDAILRLIERPESFGSAQQAAYAAYEAPQIAVQFAAIFDHVLSRPGLPK